MKRNCGLRNKLNQRVAGYLLGAAYQKGAVLVTGVIFLVVLTILVLSIMRSATLEERMAGNARNRQIALQAAEAVIRDAENTLLGKTAASPVDPLYIEGFTANCTNGFCERNPQKWKDIDWDDDSTETRTFATGSGLSISKVTSQPRYYVEYISKEDTPNCPKVVYRITARGVGPDYSTVILQTNFRRLTYAIDKRSGFKNSDC